jgi:hypothetical protein
MIDIYKYEMCEHIKYQLQCMHFYEQIIHVIRYSSMIMLRVDPCFELMQIDCAAYLYILYSIYLLYILCSIYLLYILYIIYLLYIFTLIQCIFTWSCTSLKSALPIQPVTHRRWYTGRELNITKNDFYHCLQYNCCECGYLVTCTACVVDLCNLSL